MITAVLVRACLGNHEARRSQLTYPYEATPQRKEQITGGVTRIRVAMSAAEVTSILGEPDEVLDLYDKRDVKRRDATRTGCTWWYLIQRKTDKGSAKARDEKLVRISFDLGHKVTKVDAWGLGTP